MYSFFNLPKHQVLTPEEEKENFVRIKNGDKEIRNFMIQNNIRLTMLISKKFLNTGFEQEELISIGMFGLIKAVDTFNPNKNVRFTTYATKCIANEILMELRKDQTRISCTSIDTEFVNKNNDDVFSLNEVIPDTNTNIEQEYEKNEIKLIIQEILDTLNDLDKLVIELYFGFREKKYNQTQIAEILNVSQTYVSIIIRKAINKIKNGDKSKTLVLTLYN